MSFWGQVRVAEKLVQGLVGRRFSPGSGPHLSVRWRKPISLGTAPTKRFRVPERPNIPDDEKRELRRLFANYHTYMKSIRTWMASELTAQEDAVLKAIEGATGEEAEHKRCIQINNKWNEEVAKQREARLAKERELKMEQILNELQQHELEKSQRVAEIQQIVAKEKDLSAEYITEANIDEAIENALSKETDYNYAIDRDGNYIYGFESKPPGPPSQS